ncbi:MAG: 1-(5-phosphoribosyl)-5-[(5-phosphoribosylamino)methylideneamino]imidazole-4-carboxamide isomerase [Alphaproteobacteria bacterium]|nr:1-(5-phosphoribosyl)-5-[(5-phosphoribosylamino)methylideneamino]imidazole-4-carboxamide isomerase [Alphaproteobacteria bacterium]
MEIFPAIDLKNGSCVRLSQGDFDTAKVYETDPLLQAKKFAATGATRLHVVDLDGARRGDSRQFALIERIAKETPLKVQSGGGIRNAETIRKMLQAGVDRVVIGSLAVKNRKAVQDWLKEFGPDRIVLAFDVKSVDDQPEVLILGWQDGSSQLLWDALEAYEGTGLKHILCTDVDRDGMLTGPNADLYKSILDKFPAIKVLASGGVSSLGDLKALAEIPVEGAIVGKALYEGRLDLAEALKIQSKSDENNEPT